MTNNNSISEYSWKTSAPPHTYSYLTPTLSQLLSQHETGSRILDLGCGNGWLSDWMRAYSPSVVGVDPSESGIALAKQAYPDVKFYDSPAIPGLIQTLNLDPFDIVVSTEVVEHCYAPRDWAYSCFSSLKPCGQLICSTPYHGYLKNLALSVTGKLDSHFTALWDGGHIKFWSAKTLSQLLSEVGFINLRFFGVGRIPYLWKSMIFTADKPS